jgi:hypothetical protein
VTQDVLLFRFRLRVFAIAADLAARGWRPRHLLPAPPAAGPRAGALMRFSGRQAVLEADIARGLSSALRGDLAAAQWQELVPESVKVRPASGTNRQL